MKTRFRLYRRHKGGRYYIHDETTGKQESLHTSDRPVALRLLHAKNEAVLQPAMNLQIAQVYLQHGDPALSCRTWQHVMEQIISTKRGNTRERWEYAIKDKALDLIRDRKLIQTSSEHFLDVLNKGSVSTNVFLRRTHNYAIGMHWLPWPVLPKTSLWPAVKYKEKRAITFEEHQTIINREHNTIRRHAHIINCSGTWAVRRRTLQCSPPETLIGTTTPSLTKGKKQGSLRSFHSAKKSRQFCRRCHNQDIYFLRLPDSMSGIAPKSSSNGWRQ